MSQEQVQVPKGWELRTIRDILKDEKFAVVDGPFGTQLHVSDYVQNGVPLIRIKNILWDRSFNLNDLVFISEEKFQELKRSAVYPNDILLAKTGIGKSSSGSGVCKVGLFPVALKKALIASSCAKISIDQNLVDIKYALLFLSSPFAQSQILKSSKGSTRNTINNDEIRNIVIPIPSLPTQKKIVQKLDDILGQLEERKNEIFKIQKNIEYQKIITTSKNSILEQATLGKFTKDWRKINSNILDGRLVLENIRKTNQKKASVTNSTILEIPRNWTTCFLGDVFEIQGGIQKTQKRKPLKNSYPYLRVGNVYKNRLDLSRIEHFEIFSDKELDRFRLKSGDMLVVEGNGSKNQIGRSAIWHDEIQNCVHQNHIIRCRPLGGMNSDFVSYFLNSPIGRTMLVKIAITTSGLFTLSTGKLSSIIIPLPPIEEQQEIVKIINKKFNEIKFFQSMINELTRKQEITTTNLYHIQSSILDTAFSGKLVK